MKKLLNPYKKIFWSSDIKYSYGLNLPLNEIKDLLLFIRRSRNALKDEDVCLYYTNWW